MRKLFALLLIAPAIAFQIVDTESVTVESLNDKDVYVMYYPSVEFETVGTVALESNEGLIVDQVELLIEKANDEIEGTYDAIITRDGMVGTCIRYTTEEKATARWMKLREKEIYVLSQPTKKYSVIAKSTISDDMKSMNFTSYSNELVNLVKEQENELGEIDGVITHNGIDLEFIRY